MYGTIARMRVESGHEEQVRALNEEWARSRAPQLQGYVANYVLRPDQQSNELILVAVFRDRDSYRANAADPEQDRWFRTLREHLASDPEWTDGEFVFAHAT